MRHDDSSLTLDDVLFVGFNRRVAALDKRTGQILWDWKAPAGAGFVSILVEKDQIFAAVHGHIYCLDAATGRQIWHNPTTGFGFGVTCLATTSAQSNQSLLGEAPAEQQRQQAAAS